MSSEHGSIYRPLLVLVAASLLFAGCSKTKVHDLFPIPPTTHAERQFFGCKINGLPFTPKAPSESGLGSCTYKFTYDGNSGYTFHLVSNSQESGCQLQSVSITLDSIELRQGKSYALGSKGVKKGYASYSILSDCSTDKLEMFTTDDKPGEIFISKYDPNLGFVSGTFFFFVYDSAGTEYRVSEGLFDQLFTN
jgi:hypothetical protein